MAGTLHIWRRSHMVAFAAGPLGAMRIFVRQVAASRPIALSEGVPGDHRHPQWSPDGARISFEGTEGVYAVAALGGAPGRLFVPEAEFMSSLAWSPDGQQVAYAGRNRVYLYSFRTGETRTLVDVYWPHSLAWSPDGSRIALVSGNASYVLGPRQVDASGVLLAGADFANAAPSSLWLVALDGGDLTRLTSEEFMDMSPAWLPDGDLLFVSDRDGNRDVYLLRPRGVSSPTGEPTRLTTGLGAHTIDTSADGTAVAYSRLESRSNIWAIDIPAGGTVSASEAVQITTGNQLIEGIAVAPNGEWLAFDSDRAGNHDLYKMMLPDGEPIQVTKHPAPDFLRSWSWSGMFITGHTFRNGNRDPFIIHEDGTRFELLSEDQRHERYAFLSPDDRAALIDMEVEGVREACLLERGSDGTWGVPRQRTTGGGQEPSWSPDGSRIIYETRTGITLLDLQDGKPIQLLAGHDVAARLTYPVWSPDGETVYCKAFGADGRRSIWSVSADGSQPRLLVRFDDQTRPVARDEFATDGKRFYFTLPEHQSDVWVMELARR